MFSDPEESTKLETMIMICVSKNTSVVTSYEVEIESGNMTLTGSIDIPMAEFLYFEYDNEERALFSLTAVINQDWVVYSKELHFFEVTNRIFWKNYTQNFTN